MIKKYLVLLFFVFSSCLYARGGDLVDDPNKGLFAGTLLAFGGSSYAPDQFSIEPILFITRENGVYDAHSHFLSSRKVMDYTLFLTLQTGLIKYIDAQVTFIGSQIHTENGDLFVFGDIFAYLGIQIFDSEKHFWPFDLRFLYGQSFPTGKREGFAPAFTSSLSLSLGTYESIFVLAAEKLFNPKHFRPFILNLNFIYLIPAPTDVSNITVFGGTEGTEGTVYPGKGFLTNFSFQYSLTYHVAFGFDCNFGYQNAAHFKKDADNFGEIAAPPSSFLLSLTPGIECTLNDKFSITSGVWFTFAGRNAVSFVSSYLNIYYFF
jgi:hypothetical protein